jgi:carbon starvation protein
MNAALLGLIGLIAFSLAYRFYLKFLSQKLFKLEELDESGEKTPAHIMNDGVDYVPTKTSVLLGHHFSSIAGAAPIVGPAVAAIWGWLPAFIWIVCGVIFMGASHDFGALVLSMKHKAGSMAQVSQHVVGPRVRNLFLLIIFFLVWMVIAVFALVIANLFIQFPSSVLPVNIEILVALAIGFFVSRKNKSLLAPSIIAQIILWVTIYLGTIYPITLGDHALMKWVIFLLIYSFIASTLPVWTLLQPRDYINSHQLFIGLTLMILGLFVVQPEVVAPAINTQVDGAPPIFPFLFITIACGAISGFHGLVSSGTTSKQVTTWKSAKSVGYGSMLGEGLLALLATLAVTTGFADRTAWHGHYGNWKMANGLGAKIAAFVQGSGKFIAGLGIPENIAQTVIAVMIISFAATSLDTACRIQRYIIGELGDAFEVKPLKNRFVGSGIAVVSAFALMMSADGGKGGLLIWPLFGATNQMLAGLTLTVISVFLMKLKRNALPYLIPAVFVLFITSVGLFYNIKNFLSQENYMLMSLGALLLACQVWVIFESFAAIKKYRVVNSR